MISLPLPPLPLLTLSFLLVVCSDAGVSRAGLRPPRNEYPGEVAVKYVNVHSIYMRSSRFCARDMLRDMFHRVGEVRRPLP